MNEEEKRKYEAFQYWIQTNTERGVTTIPDSLCLFIVNLIEKLQKENEKYKRLAKINLKNAEEFKDNMCENRCLLKSENEELKEDNYELHNRITELENVIIQAIDELKNINFYEPRLKNKNQKEVNKAYSMLFDALKTKES